MGFWGGCIFFIQKWIFWWLWVGNGPICRVLCPKIKWILMIECHEGGCGGGMKHGGVGAGGKGLGVKVVI